MVQTEASLFETGKKMLRRVAVDNQENGRREFTSKHVACALCAFPLANLCASGHLVEIVNLVDRDKSLHNTQKLARADARISSTSRDVRVG